MAGPADPPPNSFPTTCDVYRPFGSASPLSSAVPCRLVPAFRAGQGGVQAPGGLTWTHYLEVAAGTDLRDGCSRTAGSDAITYADGDEIRVAETAGTARYVVVWVEELPTTAGWTFKRAYLLRHAPAWS
jgi:hypothetical protein